jgi:hypothetical protein
MNAVDEANSTTNSTITTTSEALSLPELLAGVPTTVTATTVPTIVLESTTATPQDSNPHHTDNSIHANTERLLADALQHAQQQAKELRIYCNLLQQIQKVQDLLDQQMAQPLAEAGLLSSLADHRGMEMYRKWMDDGLMKLWEEAKVVLTARE